MQAPLLYLKKELNFTSAEWMALSEDDKNILKRWAEEEMIARGMA